jgi:HAD superfamily hydrolase (TIGR01490 family)
MPEQIAFFDIDHTLIKRSSGACFLIEANRCGVVPLSLLFGIPGLYFKYIFQDLHWEDWVDNLPGVHGISRDAFKKIALMSYDRRCKKLLFPKMIERVESLKAQGIPVWFATSSVDVLVQPIVDCLGADGLIASQLEFSDGISTGKFDGKPAFGIEKLRRVRDQAESLGADLRDCSFYSDSVHDLPLLEAVGTPVAVNPDFRLKKIARQRGWEIIRCSLRY